MAAESQIMPTRRLKLQKAEADLLKKLDETMQEMRDQVREHFDSLTLQVVLETYTGLVAAFSEQ